MRCEECLAVVEEYFDGELERQKGERVAAHLAACADCAAAHEALSFEQELFLRYDRGLEVGPALWEGVRAAVARLDESEKVSAPPPRQSVGLRARLAAAFGSFVPRAAFAPALALVLMAAFVGSLWLARRPAEGPEHQVASAPAAPERAPAPRPNVEATTAGDGGGLAEPKIVAPVAPAPASAAGGPARTVNAAGANAPRGLTPAAGSEAEPPSPDHNDAAEAELLLASAEAPAEGIDMTLAPASTRLPTPEEKEMARHLEQAQMLLRSFQNEAAAGGDAVQLAYERRLSRRLLAENATLQVEAEAVGDKQTRRVLDSLEPFLLDIANLRDNASRDEVRSIGERMQKKEIVAALQVY